MKKRVKNRQLSLLFSLMIIGILILIILISNYDKVVEKNLKGELETAGIFPMAGGPCIDDSDTIIRLSSSANTHGALWNESNYQYTICYNNTFGNIYSGTNSHVCKTGNTNKVVGLSGITNAHLEMPSLNNYGTNVCYGDLVCRNVNGNCDFDENAIIALSASTNAHASNSSNMNYPINICCRISQCASSSQCPANAPICNSDSQCVQCLNDSDCSNGDICYNAQECIDVTIPIISSIASSPASLSAIINWDTNENTNSTINYGTDNSNLNNSVIDASKIMNHSIELSELTVLTVYYYDITCCDNSGNCATDGTNSFTTLSQASTPPTPPTLRTNNTKISFEDKSVEVGKLIEFSISAVGLNQSKLDYSATNLPSGASFDSRIGRFSWTPGIVGEYTINFSVTDKKLTNINIIRITVTEEPSSVTIPEPIPTPTPNNYGTIIFWIIVIILIIAIIIVSILIVLRIRKGSKENLKNKDL